MTDLLTRIERGEPVEAQEVFDYSVGKVIEQGAPATNANGDCVYRTGNGNKCAFGHLIPDSLYKHSFENVTAVGILTEGQLSKNLQYSPALTASLGCHGSLITDIQRAHDNNSHYEGENFVTNFRHLAEAVAKEHGLTFKF